MKVTGTLIKGNIKLATAKIQAITSGFRNSLYYFADEAKPDPIKSAQEVISLERTLAIWQTAQKEFNVTRTFPFEARVISLQEAISSVGGYSRLARMWKEAAGAEKPDRYSGRMTRTKSITRSTDEVQAKETITKAQALVEFEKVENKAAELRTQIGIANNIEVDMTWLEEALSSVSPE